MSSLEDIQDALMEWEERVEWIARGWDCIEEYTNDLSYREVLQDLIDEFTQTKLLPSDLLSS